VPDRLSLAGWNIPHRSCSPLRENKETLDFLFLVRGAQNAEISDFFDMILAVDPYG
jgi:hypothetical protein